MRYGLVLGVIAIAVGLFMLVTVSISHGIYALIVLPLCAVALALWGGPERLARQVTVTSAGLRIERFHRVRTVIEWPELTSATARVGLGKKGRVRAELVLEPADAEVFFYWHRELRAVQTADDAIVAVGSAPETVAELNAAIETFRPEADRRRPVR